MIDAEEFISHYGKKGMKWGVRNKTSVAIKKRSNAKNEKLSPDAKELKSLRSKNPSTLSNNDLKKINERMNLEQNYNRLNAGKVKKGKQRAEVILATITVGTTAYNLLDSKAGKAAINLGKKIVTKAVKSKALNTALDTVANRSLNIKPFMLN